MCKWMVTGTPREGAGVPTETFLVPSENDALETANDLARGGYTDVAVWERHGTVQAQTTVTFKHENGRTVGLEGV